MSSRILLLAALPAIVPACGDVTADRDIVCGDTAAENVLPNGGFETSPAWVSVPAEQQVLCGPGEASPTEGSVAACLGGTDGVMQTVTQSIKLPEGVKTLTLTGQLAISTSDTAAADNDTIIFDVVAGNVTVANLGMRSNQQGMPPASAIFSALTLTATAASDPVTATFRMRIANNSAAASTPTKFFLDALALKASCQ